MNGRSVARIDRQDQKGRRCVGGRTGPKSGRSMTVDTNQEGIQVYTANWVEGITGKNGVHMARHGAICLETQRFPDAPNKPDFPPCVLKPKESYNAVTVYGFSW